MPRAAGLHGLTHLLAGEAEWRNIQTIVKTTLQAIAKIVSNHTVMLDTIDARIDRLQDTLASTTTPTPAVRPTPSKRGIDGDDDDDDDDAMVISRKEFLALVTDVRKMQKRAVSAADMEARVVASSEQLKRRLEHTISPLQETMKEIEAAMSKQAVTANEMFVTKDALDANDATMRLVRKMEATMATHDEVHALERRVTAEAKKNHRDVREALEKGLRKHVTELLTSTKDELKTMKTHVDEGMAAAAGEWQAQLRQRAMASDVQLVLSSKIDRAEMDAREKHVLTRLENALASVKQEMSLALQKKCFKSDVAKLLSRKVNREDMDAIVADRVTQSHLHEWLQSTTTSLHEENSQQLKRLQQIVEGKLEDHGEMVTRHLREMQLAQDQHMDGWTASMEDLRSKLVVKMGIKDACTLLDTKCNVADVNDALRALQQTLHVKVDECDFKALVDDVHGVRRQMRGEMCVGRWIWKVGRPSDRHTVCWNVQVVNTNPDVFAWEKGADTITALVPGLYQLQASFFTDYAPTLQVLINGEPALVLGGEKTSDARRHRRRHSAGNVTGITICEFLALPPRAAISVTYDIDERAQAFMTLRKL
ncbi:Aste57867_8233 [Aphanomyces stellatus]|uniref:Aste57867_8233 protein n=1 Tax=Aphanomyces stellatus TaxID=120398 RepID=A0A485KJS1_9STRA|nr:hypothetical protein As57867_008202 [Aphanomyces stellatus]VFT85120.1 Aste57867_8233 [Aphanomyces stellatus]